MARSAPGMVAAVVGGVVSGLREYWMWQCELASFQEEEMPTYVGQGPPRELCPEGLHHAVCVDVVDLGEIEGKYGKKHKLKIVWQMMPSDDDGNPLFNKEGRRFEVQKWYTASIHKKSNLHRDLQIWRGKPFTKEELPRFDVDSVIGANCQIQVIHSAPNDDGDRYANVQALVPYKGKEKAVASEYVRVKDRPTDGNGNGHTAAEVEEDEEIPF